MARGPAPGSSSSASGRSVERFRRRKRILVITLLTILLLPVVILVVARVFVFSDGRIRGMAEETLSQSLGRDVTIGDLDISMLSSIDIKDVKVKDKPEYGGDMLTLGTVHVAYKPFSILGDSIEIPEIRIDGAKIRVVKTPEGVMNVTDLPPAPEVAEVPEPKPEEPAGPPEIPSFNVGKITISNIDLEYVDRGTGQRAALKNFHLDGKASAADNVMGIGLSGGVDSMTVEVPSEPPRKTPPVTLKLAASFDGAKNAFTLTKAELAGDGVQAGLTAKASLDPASMSVDARGGISLDFAGAVPVALSGLDGQGGTLKINLETAGTLPNVFSQVSIDGRNLAFPVEDGGPEPAFFRVTSVTGAETLEGSVEEKLTLTGGIDFRDMGVTGKDQQIGKLTANYTMETDTRDGSARITQLKMLGPGLELDLTGDLGAEAGGARPLSLDGKLQVSLADAVEPIVPTLRDCDGTIAMTLAGSGTTLAPVIDLRLFTSPIRFTSIDTGMTCNVTGLMGSLASSLGEDQIHVPVKGELRIARVDMTSPEGKTRTFENLAVTQDMLLDTADTSVDVRSVNVSLPGLTANAKGTIAAGKQPPLVDLAADGSLDFAGLAGMARGFMGLTEEECNGNGTASFSISLASDEKNMTAGVTAESERVELTWSPKETEAAPETGAEQPPEEPAATGEAGGQETKTPEALELEGINTSVSAKIATLVLNGIAVRNARFEMQSEGNRVAVKTLRGDMAGGTLNLAVTANTGVPGWDYKVSGGIDHAGLSALIALLEPQKAGMADGDLTFNLDLSGQGLDLPSMSRSLEGGGSIAMSTFEVSPKNQIAGAAASVGQLVSAAQSSERVSALNQLISGADGGGPIRFDAFRTAFTVSDGAIRPEGGFSLSTRGITATFLGAIGIDGSFRDASLTFPLPEKAAELLGTDRLSPSLSGSLADPKVDLDVAALAKKALGGEAKKEIGGRVKDLVDEQVGGDAGKAVGDMLNGLIGGKKKK